MTFRSDLFAGRTVLVVGGTSGIGAATALRFADLGAQVSVSGLNAGGSLAPRHSRIACTELDVRSEEAMARWFSSFDAIDVLINCAGVSRDRAEWSPEMFEDVMRVNFYSVMTACRLARSLMTVGSGSIVNLASMYATFGSSDRPAYSASKGAVVQLTRSLAQEYAPEIRVNAVAPGWITTPLSENLFRDEVASAPIKNRIPFARWGEPNEVADTIVFLASPAARYVTGTTVPVDGGYLTV